jgi:DNA-binding LacI/PurR family transcriptional regulator
VIGGRDALKVVPDEVLGGRTATEVLLRKGHKRWAS